MFEILYVLRILDSLEISSILLFIAIHIKVESHSSNAVPGAGALNKVAKLIIPRASLTIVLKGFKTIICMVLVESRVEVRIFCSDLLFRLRHTHSTIPRA